MINHNPNRILAFDVQQPNPYDQILFFFLVCVSDVPHCGTYMSGKAYNSTLIFNTITTECNLYLIILNHSFIIKYEARKEQ